MPRLRYGGHLLGRRNGPAIEHYATGAQAPPATSVLFDTDGTPYYVPGTTGDIREDTDGTPYIASTGTEVGLDTDGTPYLIGA